MDIQDFSAKTLCESDQKLVAMIGGSYLHLAGEILRLTAPSAHRTAALRLLLESKMTMIHAISHQ